jgi:hypothetical protein
MQLIHFLSKDNLREVLKFVYFQSIYSLAIKYMNSKPDSRLVMNVISPTEGSNDFTHLLHTAVTNKALYRISLQFMEFVHSFDILPMYYLSTVNLHEVLKFVYLHSTYSLAVKDMKSKRN